MTNDSDFDTVVTTAWSAFGTRLADYVADMQRGDTLFICSGGGYRRDDLSLTVGMGAEAESDASIGAPLLRTMSVDDRDLLHEAGWSGDVTSTSATLDLDISGAADTVAHAVVVLLRDFRGITHPSFLAASATGASPRSVFDTNSVVGDWEPDRSESLVAEVDRALESILGHSPAKDENGTVRFEFGDRIAILRVLASERVVELTSVFPIGAGSHPILETTASYSNEWADIKFHVVHQHLIASTRVDCSPVIEEHLGRKLGMFLRFVEHEGGTLSRRLSGGTRSV